MISLFIKLVLAHIVGDFLLQPEKWVKHKEEFKHKSKYLYWHILVHLIALVIVLQFNFKYWLGLLIILISHYGIDVIKLNLKNKLNTRLLFGLDQLAHLLVIALVVNIYEPYSINTDNFFSSQFLLFVTGLLGVTVV